MPVDSARSIAPALLSWYDRHARRLPWRAQPGEAADPYAVWLSEIMLQQTTVAAVRSYFQAFTQRWPTVEALAAAPEGDVMAAWAGLGYYARARNLLACARMVAAAGGRFPEDEAGLRALPGVGKYTAAAVAAIAFGKTAVVVDANVERVVARLFAVAAPLPGARAAIDAHAARITPGTRAGDFAQAMMDLGATVCTPRKPTCVLCPLRARCAAVRTGAPEAFPVKPAKRVKPVRRGTIFRLEAEGKLLLVRRPERGLLGGMRALPTGPWSEADPGLAGAPEAVRWTEFGRGRHVFTHFALDYRVVGATLPHADGRAWWPVDALDAAGLPTLFRAAARIVPAVREAA